MNVKLSKETGMFVYMHKKGLYNLISPFSIFEYFEATIGNHWSGIDGKDFFITYEMNEILDFKGVPCQPDESYRFSDCVNNLATERIIEEFGCVTPVISQKDQICTKVNVSLGHDKIMRKIYQDIYYGSDCLFQCNYHGNFVVRSRPNYTPTYKFIFKPFVKSFKSVESYDTVDLFAALSGYLGAFLGASIFQLKDAVAYFVKKCFNF